MMENIILLSIKDGMRFGNSRQVQLMLRALVGTKTLDELLVDKNAVKENLETGIKKQASHMGLQVLSAGLRDIVLPGEMKDLLNKVTEAKKAAEANLITRREETAALRSQLNSAKMMDSNPALMRLKELEVLEKVAGSSKLNIVLSDQTGKGLSHSLSQLI